MGRIYLVIIQLFGILFVKFFFSGDVSMTMEAPGQINGGSEIKVQITINKADLTGFSRFQMDLPAGLTATNISSANADFSFKDQKVRYIWLRLPDEPTVTVSFSVQCHERLKGNFDLAGKFSFIDNNERKNVDVQPKAVTIVPSSAIDPSLLVDIKDFGKMAMPQMNTPMGRVVCIRQKPEWSPTNKEYMVTLLVSKESLKKFAKIEESVPAGFTAVNVNSKDGIFTFRDNKAKFLWMVLPADPYFTVSYKLISNKQTSKVPAVRGVFSYMANDKTQSVAIIEKDVSLANLTPEMVNNILQGQTLMASTSTLGNDQSQVADANTNTNASSSNTATAQTNTSSKEPVTKLPDVKTTTQQQINVSSIETADLLEPQTGINYRVQIAAGHKPINIKSYFRKYKLDNTILKEQHNGWIKYSVGSFNLYRDARDYRVHIWNTTSIADAFVAAYNNGKRITVQEALMVGNQKWYK